MPQRNDGRGRSEPRYRLVGSLAELVQRALSPRARTPADKPEVAVVAPVSPARAAEIAAVIRRDLGQDFDVTGFYHAVEDVGVVTRRAGIRT